MSTAKKISGNDSITIADCYAHYKAEIGDSSLFWKDPKIIELRIRLKKSRKQIRDHISYLKNKKILEETTIDVDSPTSPIKEESINPLFNQKKAQNLEGARIRKVIIEDLSQENDAAMDNQNDLESQSLNDDLLDLNIDEYLLKGNTSSSSTIKQPSSSSSIKQPSSSIPKKNTQPKTRLQDRIQKMKDFDQEELITSENLQDEDDFERISDETRKRRRARYQAIQTNTDKKREITNNLNEDNKKKLKFNEEKDAWKMHLVNALEKNNKLMDELLSERKQTLEGSRKEEAKEVFVENNKNGDKKAENEDKGKEKQENEKNEGEN